MTSYDVRRLVVRLGDHDIKREDEADHDEYSVARVIRHKGFSDQTLVRTCNKKFKDRTISSLHYTVLIISSIVCVRVFCFCF